MLVTKPLISTVKSINFCTDEGIVTKRCICASGIYIGICIAVSGLSY
jgi:hypothetical protein